MTSLKEEQISSNSAGPSSILRKEGSSTQLRKKHSLSKKKDIVVNLAPPKNDYVQISMFSPSSPSDTLFSVRSSHETQHQTNDEKEHKGKSHDAVIVVNRKKNSEDMSFSDNAEVVYSDIKTIEEAPSSYEKSFTFMKDKTQERNQNDILEEELPPNSIDGMRKLMSLRKKKAKVEIKLNNEETKIEDLDDNNRNEKEKRNSEEKQEEEVKEEKKIKKKKIVKKKKSENPENNPVSIQEEEKRGREIDPVIQDQLKINLRAIFRKKAKERNDSIEKVKSEKKVNKKKEDSAKKKPEMQPIEKPMDLRKLIIQNQPPLGPTGLSERSIDASPRWTYDPSLLMSGVTESQHILLNSPSTSFVNSSKQIAYVNTTTEMHFRDTTEATKNSSRKSHKKHKDHTKHYKEEKAKKENKEENKHKEKKKFKHKKHRKEHKEEEEEINHLKDSLSENNDEDEQDQNKPRKVLITDGLDLFKLMLDRRYRKKSKFIILIFTLFCILSLVLNGLAMADFNSAGCKATTFVGIAYVGFTIMIIFKIFCISLFNLELVYKQPYHTPARTLYSFLLFFICPLLQLPQYVYNWGSCEEMNNIANADNSWDYLIAILCSMACGFLYFGFKKRAKEAAGNISLVSRLFVCVNRLIKITLLLSVVAWNIILIVLFAGQKQFVLSFFIEFLIYVFLGIAMTVLLILKRRMNERKLMEIFVKVEGEEDHTKEPEDKIDNKAIDVGTKDEKGQENKEPGFEGHHNVDQIQIEVR